MVDTPNQFKNYQSHRLHDVKVDELIKYVHTIHSKQKVEIVVPKH